MLENMKDSIWYDLAGAPCWASRDGAVLHWTQGDDPVVITAEPACAYTSASSGFIP